ncbi:MAG: SIMPL domain-containing protein, partial [Opitutales bacterium]
AAALDAARDKVSAFLAAQHTPAGEVTFSAITTDEIMARDARGQLTNEIQYYALSQNVTVTSPDVQRIATLALRATDLIKDGVIMQSGSPEYIFTGLEKLKLDLLAKATQNGYTRARALAENSGSHVGVLTSAEQGVFQITPPYSTETLDDGAYDTTTIEKSVKAVITLEFAVEK